MAHMPDRTPSSDIATPARRRPPFRTARWLGALIIVTAGAVASLVMLATGKGTACQVTTVTSPQFPGHAQTTRVCGGPDITSFVYVLAVAGFLLLPDVQTLRVGGVEFQRLTDTVAEQTQQIRELRQTVTTTVNIGASLQEQAEIGFRDQMATLDALRIALPEDPETRHLLAVVDDLAQHTDTATWPELLTAILTMQGLIETAGEATEAALLRRRASQEARENVDDTQDIEAVIGPILPTP